MKKEKSQYPISTDRSDNPKLWARVLADGRESLFLWYYLGKDPKTGTIKRRTENLGLQVFATPHTTAERHHNRETMELAKRIRYDREQQLKADSSGENLQKPEKTDFLQYFENYLASYTKKDVKMIRMALNRFRDFLQDTPCYSNYSTSITANKIDRDMIILFAEYLQQRSRGEGAKSVYQRFKKVVNYAVEHDVIRKNPCTGIVIKTDENSLKKDVLSVEEINLLRQTHYDGENPVIRRAFEFCLFAGLRFCDVKELTFANVDYSNRLLSFEQAKTKGHSINSRVTIPLEETLLALIGNPPAEGSTSSRIFPLPSYTMCVKAVQRWCKRAGITKHITWHCARHSFAVNVLCGGADIKTLSSLLGHSGLKHTEKYTRAVDSLKRDAIREYINKLNK